MKNWTIILIVLIGCGEYESTSPEQNTPETSEAPSALYTLECDNVACPTADDISYYYGSYGDNINCTWYCVTYNSNQYVSLDFWSWDNTCYTLDSEYISNGICY